MQANGKLRFCAVALVGLGIQMATINVARAATTCKDSGGNSPCVGTNTPCVCVDLDGITPVILTDFTMDFTVSTEPNVEFLTGGDWVVWSQEHLTSVAAAGGPEAS